MFDAAVQQDVLVDFTISRGKIVAGFNLFVSANPVPEQAQIPARKIAAMIDPTVQEPEPAVKIKSVYVGCGQRPCEFRVPDPT